MQDTVRVRLIKKAMREGSENCLLYLSSTHNNTNGVVLFVKLSTCRWRYWRFGNLRVASHSFEKTIYTSHINLWPFNIVDALRKPYVYTHYSRRPCNTYNFLCEVESAWEKTNELGADIVHTKVGINSGESWFSADAFRHTHLISWVTYITRHEPHFVTFSLIFVCVTRFCNFANSLRVTKSLIRKR